MHARLLPRLLLASGKLQAIDFPIEVKQVPHHKNHWHYPGRLQARPGVMPHARHYIVLTSGKVLPGLRVPEAVN